MKKEKTEKTRTQKSILPGAMLIALLAAAIVFVVMLNAEKNALTAYEKGTVLLAKTDIPKGELIREDDIEKYFEEKEIDKTLIPEKSVIEKGQLIGLVVDNDIDSGAMITESMFSPVSEVAEGIAHPVLAGLKADDLYQAVSGVLRAGDRINIYTITAGSVGEDPEVVLAWKNVYVQQVFDSTGNIISGDDKTTAVQRMNIFLEEDSTEQFYTQLSQGTLRVVKIWE